MRIVTAYDLGVFSAQTTAQSQTAHGLGAHVVNVKTAADPVQQAASPELARKEINPFVIRGRVNADQIAGRDRAVAGLAQPSLDKEYAASGFSGFRLKPVGGYGQASGGAIFPLEYQIVATGPDGQEQLINTIKSRNAQTEPNLNPSNISKMVQQGAQRLGMKAGPKPPAPRPQTAADKFLAEHAARVAAHPYAGVAPTQPAPAPALASAAPPPPIPEPAPALPQFGIPSEPVSTPAPAIPPPPTPEAGPNGLNAGDYVPPAAPEPEPISELAPPTPYPRLADARSFEGQAVDNENARKREEYDQTLKQRQEVGNSPQDYEERAPAAPPEPESSIVSSRDVTRESAPLEPLPGADDSILPPSPSVNDLGFSDPSYVPPTATPTSEPTYGKKPLTRAQRSVGNVGAFSEAGVAKTRKEDQQQPSINDLGFADPNYVPPTATPTSEPTYGKKPLTRAQQSVGNVGAFSEAGVAKTRKEDQRKAKLAPAPATAAPTAPSVPVTPPQPPIPTPAQPKPTPPPVPAPKPEPAPAPTPAVPQYRPSAPAAPAYQPPAQSAPTARPTIGGGLFGRRRR